MPKEATCRLRREHGECNNPKHTPVEEKTEVKGVGTFEEGAEILEELPVVEVPKALPVFNGKQILRIRNTGHTADAYHCDALDGETPVTIHAPKSIF